jgi:two-component system CheB/CheR fusion protein
MASEPPNHEPAVPEGDRPVLVVGIGASAGGLKALQSFFQHLPADSDMTFVVILHLSPEYESSLAALLQSHTSMPVAQVNS